MSIHVSMIYIIDIDIYMYMSIHVSAARQCKSM